LRRARCPAASSCACRPPGARRTGQRRGA
jgi:hypothetical protein